jgi:tetratricopeptide (TPR) repeat protein
MPPAGRFARLFAELTRRRVLHVAGAYAAIGFAVAEAADLFFPRLGFPDWTVTFTLAAVVAGFPVAVVLAWSFDIVRDQGGGEGTVRLLARRSRASALASAGAAIILALAAGVFLTTRYRGIGLVRERVVVAAFENRTGDPSLDAVGGLAAEWVTDGLARSELVEVVPAAIAYASALGLANNVIGAGALPRAAALARETGAGTLVWGSYYLEGGRLQLHAHVTDVARGEVLRTIEPVSAPLDSVSAAVATLSRRAAGALGTLLNPRLTGWTHTARPPGIDAYRAYAQGLERYVASLDPAGYREAAGLFERAAMLDSTFVAASLWLAQSLANGVDRPRADSLVGVLKGRPEALTPYDRAFLDRLDARLRGDWNAAYAAAKRMTEIAPSSDDAWRERALDALRLNRLREGIRILESLDPERGWLRGWPHYWYWQAEANHLLGRHRRELEVLASARRQYPEVGWLRSTEVIAHAALGHPLAIDSVMERQASPGAPWAPLATALELNAHGHPAAERALRLALDWQRQWARLDTAATAQLYLLEALYYAGEDEEAAALADAFVDSPSGIERALALGVLGAIAARRGDTAAALQYSARLAGLTPLETSTRHTFWRARIAALLGDREEAIRLLRQALAEGLMPIRSTSQGLFAPIHVAPELLPLRGYAPFDRMLQPR